MENHDSGCLFPAMKIIDSPLLLYQTIHVTISQNFNYKTCRLEEDLQKLEVQE